MTSSRPAVHRARRIASYVCLAEAGLLAGFGAFTFVQLALGAGSEPTRVLTEGVLIVLFAAGVGLLGRLWWGRSEWPAVPTVVWHVLLVPVAVSLFQSGQLVLGLVLSFAIVAAVAATVAARRGQAPE